MLRWYVSGLSILRWRSYAGKGVRSIFGNRSDLWEKTTVWWPILSQIVEFRNGESGLHKAHINILTQLLLEKLRKSENYDLSWAQQHMIATASALHDIGKIGIDEKFWINPKAAKEEPCRQIRVLNAHDRKRKCHDEEILMCSWNMPLASWTLWWKGYPDGLKEKNPISAQVVSLADVWCPGKWPVYKKAYSHERQ